MVRAPCCDKMGVKKGPWTPDEDEKLLSYIEKHGHGSWRAVPIKAGLLRCGKSCRLRWTNYLRPDIKRGKFTLQEEQTIIQLHALLGNRWSAIASYLDKRTDNEIKNHWNTHLKKRLIKMGIDPVTHKPTPDDGAHSDVMSHKAQWESARLEAEARLTTHPKQPLMRPYSFPTNNPCYMDTSNSPLTLENSMIFTNVMDSEVSVCSSDNATVLPHYHHLMMYDHENKDDFTEEDGKTYWSNILQMVNSSSSSVTASATSANDGEDSRVSAFSPSLS